MRFTTIAAAGFALATSLITNSCSKNENPPQASSSAKISTINQTIDFTTSTCKVTDTGSGLYFSFQQADGTEIMIYTSSNHEGEYSLVQFKDAQPNSLDKGIATFAISGNFYMGLNGSIKISKNSDGKVSGTYHFSAQLFSGPIGEVTNGSFQNLAILAPPKDQLLLSQLITTPANAGKDVRTFFYDYEGKLVKTGYSTSETATEAFNFNFWLGSKIIRNSFLTINYNVQQSVLGLSTLDLDPVLGTQYIGYVSFGLNNSITEFFLDYSTSQSVFPSRYTGEINSSFNITSLMGDKGIAPIFFYLYDDKINPYLLTAKASRIPIYTDYYPAFDGSLASVINPSRFSYNNPLSWYDGKSNSAIYSYNTNGAPINITRFVEGQQISNTKVVYLN